MLSTDPHESASEAGLRYVTGAGPCIRRVRSGKYFRYIGTDGKPLKDPRHLARIRSLAIPPAWTNVWICPSPNGHLQATGRDVRGRKQYRYHSEYRSTRDQAKFSRMMAFGAALAVIRKHVARDIRRRGLPREKVLATVVRLLETTFIRVGNEEYARDNESFGLTTMHDRHVRIAGAKLMFHFRGKSGLEHSVELTDQRLARIVRECRELPGYELFQYVDASGEVRNIDSADVNHYIHEISGQDFTAKDFRTWAGTVLAAGELHSAGPRQNATQTRKTIVAATRTVATRLRNRPATCRKYYIHPAILDSYEDGSLFSVMREGEQQHEAYSGRGLRPEEYSVMVLVAEYQRKLATAA
jgi:DNA topoisomerase-1